MSNSFWNHPIANIEEALNIRKQIDALQERLAKLVGGADDVVAPAKKRGRKKGQKYPKASSTPDKAAPAPKAKKGAKRKGGLTPEGRAKLAASMKARWAARKKAAGQA